MQIDPDVTVFVTGGGGGIGLAVGNSCAARGGRVVLADIHAERLEQTVGDFSGQVLGVTMNIGDLEDWKRARKEAEARFGQVDVFVNCAAIPPVLKHLLDTSPAEFDERLAINLSGTFYGVHTFGPPMRDRGRGHIANVASDAGVVPMVTLGDYAAAKYGVVGMTEILREELAGSGVGVTTVIPGLTRTNMTVGMGMDPSFVGEAIVRGIEANAPYVMTHVALERLLDQRFAALKDAIGEQAQPDYVQEDTPWY